MNALQFETSPYLLQHKNNPVNWYAWNDESLALAQQQNKLIIVSVGYAACHWCHVMEHESFEDETVAALMNSYFVAIKVDREERPDIDQIYMNAAQLTSRQGGWPLNVICLPNGQPIYGATYFPKSNWLQFLQHFQNLFETQLDKLIAQAQRITKGIQTLDSIVFNKNSIVFDKPLLTTIWNNLQQQLDWDWGGALAGPKFMLPKHLEFLWQYYYQSNDENVGAYLKTTLKKMAFGGLHDSIGGGFARYSVDAFWKVPHFEKMLYDNAQLLSVYAIGYQLTKRPLYKSVCDKILFWLNTEMTDSSGGLYASLDADSEGVEGKFYCWSYDEVSSIAQEFTSTFLKNDVLLEFIIELYTITNEGNFEHGLNVLFRTQDHEYFCDKYQLQHSEFQALVQEIEHFLYKKREAKIKPNLDHKILTEWNSLMIIGLIDAYKAFNDEQYLKKAISVAHFILKELKQEDYRLYRNYANGNTSINAFLADYAFFIEALISLYQVTCDEFYLQEALYFTNYTLTHFFNKQENMFYITSDIDTQLIVRSMDSSDNVIASANSQMAKNLLLLGKYFNKNEFIKIATQQVQNIISSLVQHPMYYANWAIVLDKLIHQTKELVVVGKTAKQQLKIIQQHYLPNVLFAASEQGSSLPLLQSRYIEGKTYFYLCNNGACSLPTENLNELNLN